MKIYGLTGGIAAGKSAASARFIEQGIPVIDSDALGHTVIEPGGPAFQPILDEFGTELLENGKIDRAKLGDIVFADHHALKTLNSLVHPAVLSETTRLCAQYAQQGNPTTLIEAALHAEDGTLRPGLDGLILVYCPDPIRIKHLLQNRGLTKDEAIARLNSQTPPEKKLSLANWIIHNDKDIKHLNTQVDSIVQEF
jgi:dephospho-CoA kinase